MNKRLIILCKYYPYYPEFLQVEAPIIEQKYDYVDVFCLGNTYNKLTQYTGKNFTIHHKKEINNTNYFKVIKYFLIGFFAPKETIVRQILRKKRGLKSIIYGIFEYGLSYSEYKYVYHIIKNTDEQSQLILYSYWFKDTAVALSMLKKSLEKRGRNVFAFSRAHGHDLYEDRSKYGLLFQEYCLENLDFVFPCSINGEKYLKDKYPLFKNKIQHQYLGISNNSKRILKKDNTFVVVTCSNIIKLKRLELLVDELNILSELINEKVIWICIGNGECLADLKEKTKNQKFAFVSLGGMSNEKVLEYYSANKIDCFINISESEGLPVSIMEAQSFGIVTFATDVGGTSEIITDSKTGFLLPVNFNKGQLAKKIYDYFLLNVNDKKMLSKNLINNYKKYFNSTNNYTLFHNFIINLA